MITTKILSKNEEAKWDRFVLSHPLATIHQSSKWAHFQEAIPSRGKYWIIALEDRNKIIGGTVLIRHKLPKGYSWLYASRGPLLNYSSKSLPSQLKTLLAAIKPLAKKEKAIFLRIDPPLHSPYALPHFHKNHLGFQPEHTLILDLKPSETEILAQMKPKGRYNIRLAEKKGVQIHTSTDIAAFHKILKETTSRDGFSGHDQGVYENMIKTLSTNAKLYLATYQNQVIAGLLATYFKDTATYYYGASSNEFRNVMAPYLLQWQAIKDAKAAHFKSYDFLGIAPANTPNHPWSGVTDFKTKFGGRPVSYQPPQDLALKPLIYWLYRLYKRLRH